MRALDPRVVDAVWAAVEALLAPRPVAAHPLGCHRPRIAGRDCFSALLLRLVPGCSWDVAARFSTASETTLRRRRDEWAAAAVAARGLLCDVDTLPRDRGYDADTVRAALADRGIDDAVIARKRKRGQPTPAIGPLRLGLRWAVERTNSWLSNYGQLRRNTDRFTAHRLAQLALAITLIITIKLIDWADRWSP